MYKKNYYHKPHKRHIHRPTILPELSEENNNNDCYNNMNSTNNGILTTEYTHTTYINPNYVFNGTLVTVPNMDNTAVTIPELSETPTNNNSEQSLIFPTTAFMPTVFPELGGTPVGSIEPNAPPNTDTSNQILVSSLANSTNILNNGNLIGVPSGTNNLSNTYTTDFKSCLENKDNFNTSIFNNNKMTNIHNVINKDTKSNKMPHINNNNINKRIYSNMTNLIKV